MWDLIVSVPDHCLSFYLADLTNNHDRVVLWYNSEHLTTQQNNLVACFINLMQ